jgi:hypothetical protein
MSFVTPGRRLLGVVESFAPDDTEQVWTLAGHRHVDAEVLPQHARHARTDPGGGPGRLRYRRLRLRRLQPATTGPDPEDPHDSTDGDRPAREHRDARW